MHRRDIIARTGRRAQATDIIFLVERLESLVASGKKLPLTNNVVLEQAAVLELIDQLRVSVPDEVRQARRITEEAGRITERAREEGDAIHEAAEVRRGADEYAAGVLIRLEGECIKALTSIKRGIDMLDERHRPPRPPADGVLLGQPEQEATEAAPRP